ncbi:hypothetical protein CDAR_495391 [Caerostris darwini]|uniref:Uncharacterized protein n=1 Tax=Caerostris darwini TaxID=1538125 RepID=A0AAV4SB17_9ARAC|nr:hypothetical protein CDAR_495391 [Caerostris darwini]
MMSYTRMRSENFTSSRYFVPQRGFAEKSQIDFFPTHTCPRTSAPLSLSLSLFFKSAFTPCLTTLPFQVLRSTISLPMSLQFPFTGLFYGFAVISLNCEFRKETQVVVRLEST